MLPIPTRSVFRNRWWSLAWAAGICWTAVQIAGGFGGKSDPAAIDNASTSDRNGARQDVDDAAAARGRAQMDALVNSVL